MTAPKPAQPPLAISFVAHAAWGALTGGCDGHIGGVERQQSLMARWLAAHGHRVTMLTWDEGQPDGAQVDGVRVIRICRRDSGVPGIRFLHPRWTALVRAMARADADLYYQNCAEYVTGQVALWCRWRGRSFVYSVASDPDCDPRLPEMRTLRERVLYRYGLTRAQCVIVQTERQRRMLRDGFGLEAVVLPMPCPAPDDAYDASRSAPPAPLRALWLGRVCELKRPAWLLDLADACPELGFDLVGPPDGTPYSDKVIERAQQMQNVTVHGPAARDRVSSFYRRAVCLVCTSAFEGFPNTFLEAWSHGVPVVSTVDPDGLLVREGLGRVEEDVAGLAAAVRALAVSPDTWRATSARVRAYYLANHTVDSAMRRFEALFRAVVTLPVSVAPPPG